LHYRVYRLNLAGRIMSGEWVEADSDAHARDLAHDLCDAETPSVEVWQGARWVATLPCQDDAAA
jgi:hypothetical protein